MLFHPAAYSSGNDFTEDVLVEILQALDEMVEKIWYDRHSMRAHSVAEGTITIVDRKTWEKDKDYAHTIVDEIWKGALKAAKRVEKRFGNGNLGPWTDFEWGMLNGKVSALRWVLGDDWDMIDT